MKPLHIVHVLVRDSQIEHNPHKWELALMLYALQRPVATEAEAPQPAPALAVEHSGNRSARA